MKSKLAWVSAIVEVVGVAVIGGGITLEIIVGGEIFCIVITAGSLVLASGGLLWAKVYRGFLK